MRTKLISLVTLIILLSNNIFYIANATDIRKSEYPKYILDAPVFKYEKEQRKAIRWIAQDRWIDYDVYKNIQPGRWRTDKIADWAFDGLEEAYKWNVLNIWWAPINKWRFSIDKNWDMVWNKNWFYWLYDWYVPWQVVLNYCSDYQKKKYKGEYTMEPCLVTQTFNYSNFNDYKKDDWTRDINLVLDYIKVRDTMIFLWDTMNGSYIWNLWPSWERNWRALSQRTAWKWIFRSILKEKYYHKWYRDIDEELKFLMPAIFTDFKDNLTYDWKDVFDVYNPRNIAKYYSWWAWSFWLWKILKMFPTKTDEIEWLIDKITNNINNLREKSKDKNEFLRKVFIYRDSLLKMYYDSRSQDNSSLRTYELSVLSETVTAYWVFHTMNDLADWPRQEIYNFKSIDINWNIIWYDKDTRIAKSIKELLK